MRASRLRLLAVLALCGGTIAILAGCGKGGHGRGASTETLSGAVPAPEARGVGGINTKNTTRLGGAEPVDDAAAVARAVYPGLTTATRPQAVALVDERDWPAALAASSLAAAPLGAPLLYARDGSLPEVSEQALQAMRPIGASTLAGVQAIAVGAEPPAPSGYRVRTVTGAARGGSAGTGVPGASTGGATGTGGGGAGTGTGAAAGTGTGGGAAPGEGEGSGAAAASTAVGVLRVLEQARGKRPRDVIVVAAEAPKALQMPAAALSAVSGAPILFATRASVPAPTSQALKALSHPTIYVVAPTTLQGPAYAALARLGTVVRVIGGAGADEGTARANDDPVENAISVSRFSHGSFGWGIHEAGHGLVFANVARPLDAPAASPLSAHGDYGPLLLLSHSASVPAPLTQYLSNIEPGYTSAIPPVREVYNHGWLIGDESAISALAQAELDTVLEIAPRQQSPAEQSVAEAE